MFTFKKSGKSSVKLVDAGHEKEERILSLTPEGGGLEMLDLRKMYKHAKFQPNPDTENNNSRSVLFLAGPSGAGKSFYASMYIKNYIKTFKKRPIYMFSKLTEDKSLDDIKEIKRINLNEDYIKDPLQLEDFDNLPGNGALVIFDDIDTIANKQIKESLDNLKDQFLECGRHKNISVIVVSHLAAKGRETRTILNEAHSITLYMKSGANYKYILDKYVGLDSKEIAKLKSFNSRWVTLMRRSPQYFFTETLIAPMEYLTNNKTPTADGERVRTI